MVCQHGADGAVQRVQRRRIRQIAPIAQPRLQFIDGRLGVARQQPVGGQVPEHAAKRRRIAIQFGRLAQRLGDIATCLEHEKPLQPDRLAGRKRLRQTDLRRMSWRVTEAKARVREGCVTVRGLRCVDCRLGKRSLAWSANQNRKPNDQSAGGG